MSRYLSRTVYLYSGLGAVCLGLGGLVWFQLNQTTAYVPAAVSAATATEKRAAVSSISAMTSSVPAKDTYREIAERPVFLPTRRPLSSAAAATSTHAAPSAVLAASPLKGYALMGVMLDGDDRVAILKQASSAATLRVVEGDKVQGWTATKITADGVVFRAGGNEYVVAFPKPVTSSTNPSASAPRPAPVPHVNAR